MASGWVRCGVVWCGVAVLAVLRPSVLLLVIRIALDDS